MTEPKLDRHLLLLIMHLHVVSTKGGPILKHEHLAHLVLTDMMVPLAMASQLVHIFEDFIGWQVLGLDTPFTDPFALLFADLAEVVGLAIVHIQSVLVVVVVVDAKVALRVVLVYVSL